MRIVAGEFRGRQLSTPSGDATRPTAARARVALFAILRDVRDERVLDLYAGSGALGLEALSRGAEQLVLVESNKAAQQAIRSNLQALGVGARATLVPLRAEASLLAPAARLVLEHAARTPPVLSLGARLSAIDSRRWGDTGVTIFELIEEGPGSPLSPSAVSSS